MVEISFTLSKVIGFFLEPLHGLSMLILITAAAAWFRISFTRFWATLTLVATLLIGALPLWNYWLYQLESNYKTPDQQTKIAGIIVLGGAMGSGFITEAHHQVPLNSAAERMTTAVRLMREHPTVPVVFSGFSGDFIRASLSESDLALRLIGEVSGSTERVLLENQSRNTLENARFTKALIGFADGGSWLLVTSAFHMSRAAEMFQDTGIPIVPYPTDFRSRLPSDERRWNLLDGADHLGILLHEWVGMRFYRWFQAP